MSKNTEARKSALRILERADRTENELREKLLKKGYAEEETDDAVDYARSFGYIDDARYAEHYIGYQKQFKSLRRIRFELIKKGIREEIMEAALEDAASSGEKELIDRLVYKKLHLPSEPAEIEIEKCKAYLYRQGFRMSDILDVMHKYGF